MGDARENRCEHEGQKYTPSFPHPTHVLGKRNSKSINQVYQTVPLDIEAPLNGGAKGGPSNGPTAFDAVEMAEYDPASATQSSTPSTSVGD